jgi:G3E family GTPase
MIHAFIITGFLGVGKSSMLTNTIKNHFKDKNIAIVVNEFGEVGVDQEILKNVHSDVIEISEGCICCQMAEEFESGVIEITNKYKPDILFVETSGAAEPFPVFLSLQNLGLSVDGVICVVDAKNYNSYMDNPTAKYQVGGSNIIVLNKTDLVTKDELAQVHIDITEYKVEHDLKNTFTGKKVFNNYFMHTSQDGIVGAEVFEGSYQIDEIVGLAHDYHSHDHHEHDLIAREVSKIQKDIVFDDLDQMLNSIPKNIYRLKGIIKTIDVPTPLIVNYSFGNVSFDELADYKGESILVFIGEDIKEDVHTIVNKFDYLKLIEHTHEEHTHEHIHEEHTHN